MSTACPHNQHISCSHCSLSKLCLPLSLEVSDLGRVDEVIKRGAPHHKNEHIYRVGDTFTSIYAVRSGSFKCVRTTTTGEEQITGFFLPGEIFGLDGLGEGQYLTTAIAMETSSVCKIPFDQLESLSLELPSLRRHFFQIMSRELIVDQTLISLLGKNAADERIAALLLSLSARYERQCLSATEFIMPMSRTDIANYLGLTLETTSRTFSHFRKQGIIDYKNRNVTLHNIETLRDIAPTYQ